MDRTDTIALANLNDSSFFLDSSILKLIDQTKEPSTKLASWVKAKKGLLYVTDQVASRWLQKAGRALPSEVQRVSSDREDLEYNMQLAVKDVVEGLQIKGRDAEKVQPGLKAVFEAGVCEAECLPLDSNNNFFLTNNTKFVETCLNTPEKKILVGDIVNWRGLEHLIDVVTLEDLHFIE
eukprot:TRINITY_DN20469_c0_g1_i1.p1 TRINITY_DN20469_c0_g1~~TRINITY_DN20469_c0_g1_i1.p1  ORF type:complete len:179 (+),score=22.75 TRINITY_DN20469_c0_g1_i1:149-685(+)